MPEPPELPIRQVGVTTSRDRLVLDAWVVPGEGPHTVVVCHGMGREKSSVVAHIRMLHTAGYHVVAYDLRNHGGSGRDRRWTRMADRFTSDLADVLHYVRHDATLGGGRLAVLAFSFSTWPAVYVLRERSIDVSAVICDSGPLYDIPAGFEHFSQLRRPALPGWLRQGSAFSLYRSAFRRVADRILAVRSWPPDLTGVATPLLFIAGSDDVIVPPTQVQPVAEHYAGATYWVAPNARHMSAVRTDRADYESRVTGFLADAFARATPGSRLEQAYE